MVDCIGMDRLFILLKSSIAALGSDKSIIPSRVRCSLDSRIYFHTISIIPSSSLHLGANLNSEITLVLPTNRDGI